MLQHSANVLDLWTNMEVALQRILGDHAKRINYMVQDKDLVTNFKECELFKVRDI